MAACSKTQLQIRQSQFKTLIRPEILPGGISGGDNFSPPAALHTVFSVPQVSV
jgi:hypothetical protein